MVWYLKLFLTDLIILQIELIVVGSINFSCHNGI